LRRSPLAARVGPAQRRRLTSSVRGVRRGAQSAFSGHHRRGRHPSPWRMQGSGANPWLRMRKSKRPSDRCGPFARAAGKFTTRSCALMRVQPSRRQNLRRSRNIGGEPSFEHTRRSKLPQISAAQAPWRPEDIFPPAAAPHLGKGPIGTGRRRIATPRSTQPRVASDRRKNSPCGRPEKILTSRTLMPCSLHFFSEESLIMTAVLPADMAGGPA
jgi:hypothetical protein